MGAWDDMIGVISRAVMILRSTDSTTGLSFIQAAGLGDALPSGEQDLIQENDLDHVQHYGFESYPPADTELIILDANGGEVAIGERSELPSALASAALASGESRTYGADAQYIKHVAGGETIHEPKAGQFIKLGSGATKKLVLDGDSVNSSGAFDTWAGLVETRFAALGVPFAAPDKWGVVGPVIGTAVASATKVKGE